MNGEGHKELPFQINKPTESSRSLIFQYKKETLIETITSILILGL
ncbi:hypothetical protein LEP1GSC018_3550 [Leptospira kirschneri str. 2008720114]|uniref:Uncharacterized protein n=1 Tax=Leptospira kirschneri str. H1 TaxID=1049966 RepID=A0A0E2B7E9_9LEPT|nr:hypothetical protein LEP1GSC081_2354 [Leptospira kirschneri str. H1]EKP04260.1 hypothetical protein LEP1GSC018_3550 [Leptospira kirschneri str. 2008720114]